MNVAYQFVQLFDVIASYHAVLSLPSGISNALVAVLYHTAPSLYLTLNFTVEIRGGIHEFPIGARPYDQVTLLNAPRAFGDLDGDQYQDAVIALQIGHGDLSVTELEMVGVRNGKPTQVASYSLGHTKLNAITIHNRKMKANVTGTFPGDPGPRNTEYTFALPPSAMVGTGAVRQ